MKDTLTNIKMLEDETSLNFKIFSVVIPTWNRIEMLSKTLERLRSYNQWIFEIIVLVDFGDQGTLSYISGRFPEINISQSIKTLGPGGLRNILINRAKCNYILSLDDDSYPIYDDFFAVAYSTLQKNATAGIVACNVVYPYTPFTQEDGLVLQGSFEGCGCIYKKKAFKEISGYIPIQWAYGVEEQDLSLQLLDREWDILLDKKLIVFHDTELKHHSNPQVNAATISNRLLLTYLRFPLKYLFIGLGSFLNRIVYCIRMKRYAGIMYGIIKTPLLLYKYRSYRKPVRAVTILKWRDILKKNG